MAPALVEVAEAAESSQSAFRAMLRALSYPGERVPVAATRGAPDPMSGAMASMVLALLDQATPVWLDPALNNAEVRAWLRYRCGSPTVDACSDAAFALICEPEQMPDLHAFHAGDAVCPDRSTTLLLQVPSLETGPTVVLTGPGIETTATMRPAGLSPRFWRQWAANAARYPLGTDGLMTDGLHVLGLPRTVRSV